MFKCPECNRTFKTKVALAQHRRDAHQQKQVRKQKASAFPIPQSVGGNSDLRLRTGKRVEYYSTVTLKSGQSTVSGYQNIAVHDTGVSLKKISKVFEMVRIHSFKFHYRSLCSTTRDGFGMLAIDLNSKTGITPITKDKLMGIHNISVPIYEKNKSITVQVDSSPRFVTSSDNRDTFCSLYWYASTTKATADLDLFDIYVEYDLDLYGLSGS